MVTHWRGWGIAAVVTIATAAIQVSALADRSRGEPASDGIRRYVLGEISDGLRVEQQFLVKANGLSAVTIYPRPMASDARGSVTVAVRDLAPGDEDGSGDSEIVRIVTVPLSVFLQSEAFTIDFTPQPSFYHRYRLEVTVADVRRDHGFGLLAARGSGYRDGVLTVNGTRKWGGLAFHTAVEGATSNFDIVRSRLRDGGVPAPGAVLGALVLAQNAALFLVLAALMAGYRRPD